METWTSRKFIFAVAVLVGVTGFVLMGKASFGEWKAIVEWISLTYFGANVLDQTVQKFGGK